MAPSGVRLALIDDDSGLLSVLDRRLEALGWQREALGYGASHDQLAALRLHALIYNPAIAGLDYVERVAAALPGLGLLVVASPASVADRVRALRGGADDWITKPCHPDELVARVEAVLRRRRMGDVPSQDVTIEAGELAIRPDRFDVYVSGQPASLSRREYELLHLLASADGQVLEREDVYQRVWGYTMARGDRSVDVFVRKLRLKLEAASPGWRYVHTHFGVGYRFAAELLEPGADAPGTDHPVLPPGLAASPSRPAAPPPVGNPPALRSAQVPGASG